MKDLYIGDFEPPQDDDVGKAGILDNEKNGAGGDDLVSRALLAIFVIAVIYFLFT